MKKLSFLTLTLLASLTGIYANEGEQKDPVSLQLDKVDEATARLTSQMNKLQDTLTKTSADNNNNKDGIYRRIEQLEETLTTQLTAKKEEKPKDHICKQISKLEGALGGKFVADMSMLLIGSKLDFPANIIASAFPIIGEMTKAEIIEILENKDLYSIDNPLAVKFISALTNGWNIIGAALGTQLAGYLYYKYYAGTALTEKEAKMITSAFFYAYAAAQTAVMVTARKTLGKSVLPEFNF